MIHELADCKIEIPESTNVWQFTVVLEGAQIGKNCNICANCFVESGVEIGDNCTLKCGVYLWDGIVLEDNVFLGPNATFCNDRYPRSKVQVAHKPTRICRGASIGARAVVLDGITIGENAMVGAGSVVTRDVPAGELWYGNPARFVRKIEE